MTALAVLMTVVGGIAAGQAIIKFSDRKPVVVMARAVPSGQEVTAADLTTSMVAADATVATVPGSEIGGIAGRRAALDLPAGMLLNPSVVTTVVNPLPGKQLVPVAIKPSRLPGRGLKPGDLVLVAFDATDETETKRDPLYGVVDKVVPQDADGLVVVDLLVDEGRAAELAERVGSGQVVLVLAPGRP